MRWMLIVLLMAGCNLTTDQPSVFVTATELPTSGVQLPTLAGTAAQSTPLAGQVTPTPGLFRTATPDDGLPTLLPLPGVSTPAAVSGTPLGAVCEVYTTYSGVDPNNKLSLRDQPSPNAVQVFRVPNNDRVFRIPGSQEVEAEGYHWINVIYVDTAQNRYTGWMARDSFMERGVRRPEIATLQSTGTQTAC